MDVAGFAVVGLSVIVVGFRLTDLLISPRGVAASSSSLTTPLSCSCSQSVVVRCRCCGRHRPFMHNMCVCCCCRSTHIAHIIIIVRYCSLVRSVCLFVCVRYYAILFFFYFLLILLFFLFFLIFAHVFIFCLFVRFTNHPSFLLRCRAFPHQNKMKLPPHTFFRFHTFFLNF